MIKRDGDGAGAFFPVPEFLVVVACVLLGSDALLHQVGVVQEVDFPIKVFHVGNNIPEQQDIGFPLARHFLSWKQQFFIKKFFLYIEKKNMSAELGAVVTNPKNGYAQLDSYNLKSIWGPPISPIVPPMQYIQLPHEYNNYGYNALSHDYNGVGYYTVESGYGKKCTSFHMAQCPNNEPIRPPAPPIVSTPPPMVREPFTMEKKKPLNETIQDLGLVVYVDAQNCPHSQTILSMLRQNGVLDCVRVKDISNMENRNELMKNGASGIPFIKSTTLGTSITGAPPSAEMLIKALAKGGSLNKPHAIQAADQGTDSIHPNLARQLQDLDLVVYTSDSCHFCVMFKAFIKKSGLSPYFKIIDLTNKEHVANDPFLQTNQLPAIPFTYSRRYKTSFNGMPSSANKGSVADTVQEMVNVLTTQST
jgi:glutaredoxin